MAKIVGDRERKLAVEPVGRERIARLGDDTRRAVATGLRDERQLIAAVEMEDATSSAGGNSGTGPKNRL